MSIGWESMCVECRAKPTCPVCQCSFHEFFAAPYCILWGLVWVSTCVSGIQDLTSYSEGINEDCERVCVCVYLTCSCPTHTHTHTPTPHPVLDNARLVGLWLTGQGCGRIEHGLSHTWSSRMGCVKRLWASDVDFPMKSDWDIHPGRTRGATRWGLGGWEGRVGGNL